MAARGLIRADGEYHIMHIPKIRTPARKSISLPAGSSAELRRAFVVLEILPYISPGILPCISPGILPYNFTEILPYNFPEILPYSFVKI